MIKVVDCFSVGKYSILVLGDMPPLDYKKSVRIENVEYETEIVYDFPNAIGIKANGNFKGKTVEFN